MVPWLAPYAGWLLEYAAAQGWQPRVTSIYRSHARQRQLYAAWQRGQNRYPVARPGTSYHEFGRAMDVVARDLPAMGAVWRSMGGTWGAQADPIHFHA